jgi:mono/diheme cytochrome c family protein
MLHFFRPGVLMNNPKILAVIVLLPLLGACDSKNGGDAEQLTKSPAERAAALDQGPRAGQTLKLNGDLADRGAFLFDDKSCSDCHTLGEADVAPDLVGVLDRRTQDWLTMQIIQPEWMNIHDVITKGLIEEFEMEMVAAEVSEAEAEAILHFLLRESEGAAP